MRALGAAAALAGALLVAAAAAGAHLVPEAEGARWTSALTLGLVHAAASLAALSAPVPVRLKTLAAGLMIGGIVLFSGLQMARMLAEAGAGEAFGLDRVGFLIPLGGLAYIAGWLTLAAGFVRRPRA